MLIKEKARALKVNIIHPSLNPCGGGERLSLTTMHAIIKIGEGFDITTYEIPDKKRLQRSFGTFGSVFEKAGSVNILQSALEHRSDHWAQKKYDITIHTHVDSLPYYLTSYTKKNCISYCNFPTAVDHIHLMDEDYLRETRIYRYNRVQTISVPQKYKKKIYFKQLLDSYSKLMKNSVVLTNSKFSKKAISNRLGVKAKVLYPPVETKRFRPLAVSKNRDDVILVLCRIVPYKTIENAISIAKILKLNKIGKGMRIIGNMYDDDYMIRTYYSKLLKMVKDDQLDDYVSFQINLTLDDVIENMRKASVYLHTKVGEQFGISTVEAMSAGLIPIVPDIGGHTEFVPQKYQFNTAEKASSIISSALMVSGQERLRISDSVKKFSVENFLKEFQAILRGL